MGHNLVAILRWFLLQAIIYGVTLGVVIVGMRVAAPGWAALIGTGWVFWVILGGRRALTRLLVRLVPG